MDRSHSQDCVGPLGVEKIERVSKIAGAVSFLAVLRLGLEGGWTYACQKLRYLVPTGLRKVPCAGREAVAKADERCPGRKRRRQWLGQVLTLLWVAVLLLIVAYATIQGEAMMADLDQLHLFTPHTRSASYDRS
jgi:hypothetical protein